MKLTVVTINYNGSQETIKLLESLRRQTDSNFETIIIDNASEAADFENLEKYHAVNYGSARGTLIIKNNDNLGFSGGNNTGIRRALKPLASSGQETSSDWVILLNNDTWVKNDLVASLKPILAQKQGVVGLPLAEGGRTAYCGKIEWLKPTLAHVYQKPACRLLLPAAYYIIGGAMAIHKDVFGRIGLLDEKYFLYFEDADFVIRARKSAVPVSIINDAVISHGVSTTTRKLGSPLLLRYHYRNALYFNLKNGSWYIKLAVWPWSWAIALKQIIKIVMSKNTAESRAILNGVADFYKNRTGKI